MDNRISIKDFVQRNTLIFKAGRGFYEFTKPETVSHKKEVVLVDKGRNYFVIGTLLVTFSILYEADIFSVRPKEVFSV